jgi:hypothetical protein
LKNDKNDHGDGTQVGMVQGPTDFLLLDGDYKVGEDLCNKEGVTDQPDPLPKVIVWTIRVCPITPKRTNSYYSLIKC